MNTFVILLRGVTPTGKNKVPMADLRIALTKVGLFDVQTYIQSGNVIISTALNQIEIEQLVHDTIVQKIGADLTIIAKTPKQLQQTMKNNPFSPEACARTYFTWLASMPDASCIEDLLHKDFAPDEVKVIGDVIYTLYGTQHSDSKFNNNFFERKLKVSATTRNFNTLSRLIERTI